jgi:hypothetical protein
MRSARISAFARDQRGHTVLMCCASYFARCGRELRFLSLRRRFRSSLGNQAFLPTSEDSGNQSATSCRCAREQARKVSAREKACDAADDAVWVYRMIAPDFANLALDDDRAPAVRHEAAHLVVESLSSMRDARREVADGFALDDRDALKHLCRVVALGHRYALESNAVRKWRRRLLARVAKDDERARGPSNGQPGGGSFLLRG